MRTSIFHLLLLLFLLIPLFAAISQWSSDPYENTIVAYQAYDPHMISDGAGGAIIVWWSSTDYGLHAQRLDKYGYARWGNNGVFVGGIGWYQGENFGVCEDGNGGCVVSFADVYGEFPPYYFSRLYAQRIDSMGVKRWGIAGIPVCGLDSIYVSESHAIADGLGGFFVIWDDIRHGTDSVWLYGQHLNGDGSSSWIQNGISISGETNYDNLYPAIVSGGPGYALAFWHEQSSYLWGQRTDRDANFYWGDGGLLISEIMRFSNKYQADDQGGAILSSMVQNGVLYSIYSQMIDSFGNSLWGENGIVVADSLVGGQWSTTVNDSGQFCFWGNGEVGSFRLFLQRVSLSGNLVWQQNGLQLTATPSCNPVAIASSSNTEICSWLDYSEEHTLIAGKLDSDANRLWPYDIQYSFNTDRYDNLNITSDLMGGAIICWSIYPEVLYAQQISSNGNLGEVLNIGDGFSNMCPIKMYLLQNYPNPFNEWTVIPIIVPELASGVIPDIHIRNILGEEVNQLEIRSPRTGINYLHWNGQNRNGTPVASGIYFVQIRSGGYRECIPVLKLR